MIRNSQLRLTSRALEHLARFINAIVVDRFETTTGAKREKKLAKVAEAHQKQAWELAYLCDEPVDEECERERDW